MPTKILTVDDNRTVRMAIQRALLTYDCIFFEASDGEEGLCVAAREKPDLIILDIGMPVMDGITMLGTLRHEQELKATPVMMLTAESNREDVARVSGLGVSGYLSKPFHEEALLDKVREIVPLPAKTA